MNWSSTSKRYGSVTIGLHWLIFFLIVAVYACMELRPFFPRGSDARATLKTWHLMLGFSVLVLAWLHLAFYAIQVAPRIEPEPSAGQDFLAKMARLALYIFMLGMPLVGWLILSASGKPISFYGLDFPALIAENKDRARLPKNIHGIGGTADYYLIGIHATAALFHHYVQRDNTLSRILPGKR